jgi:hypothetical protein
MAEMRVRFNEEQIEGLRSELRAHIEELVADVLASAAEENIRLREALETIAALPLHKSGGTSDIAAVMIAQRALEA